METDPLPLSVITESATESHQPPAIVGQNRRQLLSEIRVATDTADEYWLDDSPRVPSGENDPVRKRVFSEEHKARISAARKRWLAKHPGALSGENNPQWDRNIEEVKLAIAAHAGGVSMNQASLNQGFAPNWLFRWTQRHPERFKAFYAEAANTANPGSLRSKLAAFVLRFSTQSAGPGAELSRN